MVRAEGKKEVTQDWLDRVSALGRTLWFMDDGSNSQSNETVTFHTEGYSARSVECIQAWLDDLGYGPAKIGIVKQRYFVIRLLSQSSRNWKIDHVEYACPSMLYKFQ